MSMIPPPPPIPGMVQPVATQEQPQQPVQNLPPAPPPPVIAQPAPPPQVIVPDVVMPGTMPAAQATGEVPSQFTLAVPPGPLPPTLQTMVTEQAPMPSVAPPGPPPTLIEQPAMPEMPVAPVMPAAPPQMPPAPIAQAAPAMPAAPQMPPAPVMPAAPQMPAAPAQQYAPVQAPVQQYAPQQELAVAQPTGLMPTQQVDFERMSLAEAAEAMGLKGVDFTAYGTTPTISLNQGTFKTSDGTINLGTEFICRIHETRPKYLYVTRLADSDPNHAVAYSYDQATSNGKPLADILNGWAQRGIAYDIKNYLEATCVLEDDRVVMLSIPFTSMSRFAGFAQSVILSRRMLSDVVCKVGIGPLVTKAARPFNPIAFSEVR